MALRDLDLNIQKTNPNRLQVLKGSLGQLNFDLIADCVLETGRPASHGTRRLFQYAGNLYEADIADCLRERRISEGYAFQGDPGKLPCTCAIHMVFPIIYQNRTEFQEFLWSCYWNSLAAAYDYVREHEEKTLSMAFDVMENLSESECTTIVKSVCKLRRLYPQARTIDLTFVCSDALSYTNMKKVVRREKYS